MIQIIDRRIARLQRDIYIKRFRLLVSTPQRSTTTWQHGQSRKTLAQAVRRDWPFSGEFLSKCVHHT